MSAARKDIVQPTVEVLPAERLFVSPRARRLARERGLNLAHIRGSGPRGRIVAADVEPIPEPDPQFIPATDTRSIASAQVSALGIEFGLAPITTMLAKFSRAGLSIDVGDVMVRAASAALSVALMPEDGRARSICLELASGILEFSDASAMSFSAIHQARNEASRIDPSHAAFLSIRIVDRAVSPMLLPPLSSFHMRLALAFTPESETASCTLFFREEHITADIAMSILASLRLRLEVPVLLLL